MIDVMYRQAEVASGPFDVVVRVRGRAEAVDELASWQGPRLRHGDLARVVASRRDDLYVFDSATSSFVEVRPWLGDESLLTTWEHDRARGDHMLSRCRGVDLRKVVVAACECVRPALRFSSPDDRRPAAAIDTALRWSRGAADGAAADRAAAAAAVSVTATQAADVARSNAAYAATCVAYAAARAASYAMDSSDVDLARDCVDLAARSVRLAADAELYGNEVGGVAACSAALYLAARVVREHVPLSVLACSLVGISDPLPFRVARR